MTKSTSGPSRLKNKRQAKIVEMIHGYDSTLTLSTVLRNVLLIWVLPGFAYLALGVIGFGASSPSMEQQHTHWLASVEGGMLLLSVLTAIVSVLWAIRTWRNIRRLGKVARLGVWRLLVRHFWFFVGSVIFAIAAAASPANAQAFIAVSGLMAVFACAFVPALVFELIRLFWRTGSPINGGPVEELPHSAIAWFVSFFVYCSITGASALDQFSSLRQILVIAAGASCMIAAVTGSMTVMAISRRHDARLGMIVEQAEPDERSETSVTTHQIESAWADSENLVRFEIH